LIEGCYFCGPPIINDNLVTVVAPIASGAEGELESYLAFATSGGSVQLTRLDGVITYSVSLAAPAAATAVPGLSPAGLLLLGALLALGTAMILRRRVR
jgi:hypothetical protein